MQQTESRDGRCRGGKHAGTIRRSQVRWRTAGGAAGRTEMLRVPQAAARRTTTAGAGGVRGEPWLCRQEVVGGCGSVHCATGKPLKGRLLEAPLDRPGDVSGGKALPARL